MKTKYVRASGLVGVRSSSLCDWFSSLLISASPIFSVEAGSTAQALGSGPLGLGADSSEGFGYRNQTNFSLLLVPPSTQHPTHKPGTQNSSYVNSSKYVIFQYFFSKKVLKMTEFS